MQDEAPNESTISTTANSTTESTVQVSPVIINAGRWFWWVAGFSLINSIVHFAQGGINFVIGLGITQVFETLFSDRPAVSIFLDLSLVGFFWLVGTYAQRGVLAAFVIGIIVYLLDAGIYAYANDWIPVAFHAYVLYCLSKGVVTLAKAKAQ